MIGTAATEMICVAVFVSGLIMIVSRLRIYTVLRKKNLLEKLGNPRRFFFSDALPIKLVGIGTSFTERYDRALIWVYLLSWVVFLAGIVLIILSFLSPTGA